MRVEFVSAQHPVSFVKLISNGEPGGTFPLAVFTLS